MPLRPPGHFAGWAIRALVELCLLSTTSCAFEPVARRAVPEQLLTGHVQTLGRLDPLGTYALIARETSEGELRLAIYAWRRGKLCDLPSGAEPVAATLLRPERARSGTALLLLPMIVHDGERTELVLVDENCSASEPLGEAVGRTVRSATSQLEQRGFLIFRDASNTLSVFDPWSGVGPLAIAHDVTYVKVTTTAVGEPRDALWLIEDGALSQRTLSGELRAQMGQAVSAVAVNSSDPGRVAFVDGDAVYEAVAPDFEPVLLAQDACAPAYVRQALELFSPCATETLVRVRLANGKLEELMAGTFASSAQEGVRLDYTHPVEQAEAQAELFATWPGRRQLRIEPLLVRGAVYVLDERRIAGLDELGRFGVWNADDASFQARLHGVATVVPHHRGKKHAYSWLVHHDLAEALGKLSLLSEEDLTPRLLATGVPLEEHNGFVVDSGSSFPRNPLGAPIVLLLEDATPLGGEPPRYEGSLRALSITGDPSALLGQRVSSYTLIGAPVPGVLYGVEAGPQQGLWFVAL